MSPFVWLAVGVTLYALILLLVIGVFVGGDTDEGFTWPDDPPEQL